MASGKVDLSKLSDQELADYLNNQDAAKMQQSKAEGKPLIGSVSNLTPEQEQRATKTVSQMEQNPLVGGIDPIKTAGLGLLSVPEDLANFGAAVGQGAMNVPQQNRMTVGDLMRRLLGDQAAMTPAEFMRSQAVQQHSGLPEQIGAFVGSLAAPVGGGSALLGKVAPGALGALKAMNPLARTALTGAAYAPAFGVGAQFGQNRTMPSAPEVGGMAAFGGALGGGLGMVPKLAGAVMKRGKGAPAAAPPAQVPPANINNILGEFGLGGSDMSPEAMANYYRAAIANIENHANLQAPRKTEAVRQLLGKMEKHSAFKEEGGVEAKAKLKSEVATGQYKKSQAVAKEQKAEAKAAKKENQLESKRGTHTDESGNTYRDLYDAIEASGSPEHLRMLEKQIHDPGMTADGKRLLDTSQQKNLMSQFYRRLRQLSAEKEGGGAGESKGAGESSKPAPKENMEPSVKNSKAPSVQGASETSSGTNAQPVAKPTQASSFLTGTFRKELSGDLVKPENRYKVAVSVNALADLGGLEQKEATALGKWVKDLSETAVELKAKKLALQNLVKWAVENTDSWEPKQGDILKTYFDTQTKAGNKQFGIILHKVGELRNLFLNVKLHEEYEAKTETQIEYVRSKMFAEGAARGDRPHFVVDPNPTVSTTVNGIAKDWTEKQNGGLEVKGMAKFAPEFVPPKNLDQLWDRSVQLKNWLKHFSDKMEDIRDAEGEHDHLGDGTKPIDLLQKVFDNRKEIWAGSDDVSKVPAAHVWHVDDFGHVSTVRFEQQKMRSSFGEAMKDLEARFNDAVKNIKEKATPKMTSEYDVKWLNKTVHAFTGLEAIPWIAAFASKGVHELATTAGRSAHVQALTVGTIDNIIRAKTDWGGHQISGLFHHMLGKVLDSFGRDQGNLLHRINGAEDLTELLNQFKGVKLSPRAYAKHALQQAVAKGENDKKVLEGEVRKALTAHMIRREYQSLADVIKPIVEELGARKTDVSNKGNPLPKDRMKKYRPEDFDAQGKLKNSAYDAAFHDALKSLHESLTLNEHGSKDGVSQLLGRVVARKNASIFGNNFSVGFGNFFDAGIPTLLQFHKHFAAAAGDLATNKEAKEFVKRLPILPQADMEYIKLQESMRNRGEPQNAIEFGLQKLEDFQDLAGRRADFIFKGKERIVSMADRLYSRTGALASIYKQADMYGMKGPDLLKELVSGNTLSASQRATVYQRVSEDLGKLYNSVAPHLNRDLLSSSALGPAVTAYSTPVRRTFRFYWDLARSDDPVDKLKFGLGMAMQTALAGRGVIPKSAQWALLLAGGSMSAQWVEQGMQNLDEMNIMRKATGVDLADRMGFDMFNVAGPPLEALADWSEKSYKITKKQDGVDQAAALIDLTLGETLSLLPRIGPFGYDVWGKAKRGMESAQKGYKVYYVQTPDGAKPVTVPGYNYFDAMRDWMVPGLPPAAFDEQQRIRMSVAKKTDLAKGRSRDIIPASSSTESQGKPLIPTINKEG